MSERYWVTEERPRRPDLESGTRSHYQSAEYYDRAYKTHKADIDFYLTTALEHGGPILELGCGTGRIALPLARAGFSVTGVDISPEMLGGLRRKLDEEPPEVRRRVKLEVADMRSLQLNRRYKLVISPFNAMQHLYTLDDFEQFCHSVKRHMMPRAGRFAFDVLLPDVTAFSRNPTRRYKLGKIFHPEAGKKLLYQESFDYDPIAQVQFINMHFTDPYDEERSFMTPLAHRQFFPIELEALIRYNGFETLYRFGDFDRSPLGEDSESQIYVCRLARARARV